MTTYPRYLKCWDWFKRNMLLLDAENVSLQEDQNNQFNRCKKMLERIWLWERPIESLLVINMLTVVFWANVLLQTPLVLAASSAVYACLFLYNLLEIKMIREEKNEQHFNYNVNEPERELIDKVRLMLHCSKKFRRERPGLFCICVCSGALLFWLIGRNMPCAHLFYSIGLGWMTIPGILYKFPMDYYFWKEWDKEIEEFLPVVTEDNLEVLQRAGERGDPSPTPLTGSTDAPIGFEFFELNSVRMPDHDEASIDGFDTSDSETESDIDEPDHHLIFEQQPEDIEFSSSESEDDNNDYNYNNDDNDDNDNSDNSDENSDDNDNSDNSDDTMDDSNDNTDDSEDNEDEQEDNDSESVSMELSDQDIPTESDDSGSDFEMIDINELNEFNNA